MREYLTFRKMITPVVIQVVFWIGIVGVVVAGIVQLTQNFIGGIAIIVLGPLAVRVYAEILIVLFEMNAALQDIRPQRRGATPTLVTPAPAP